MVACFGIQLKTRLIRRRPGNDIDDAADGVGPVFSGRRTTDDLNAFNIFRTDTHCFIAGTHVFGHITDNRLSVDKDQRMPRIGTADSDTYTSHGINGSSYAGFTENKIFHRLGLFLFDIRLCNNRSALRFIFSHFFSRIHPNDDIAGINAPPRCRTVRRQSGSRQPRNYGANQKSRSFRFS